MEYFEIALVLITVFSLSWGAYEDIKSRLAPDKIWIIQIGLSIPFLIIWFTQNQDFIARALVVSNIILGVIIAFVFAYLGAFGGGDSKALIATSISSPILLSFHEFTGAVLMPSIFFFLVNMFILFIIFALFLLIYNLSTIRTFGPLFGETSGNMGQKISILISGRRLAKDKVENLRFEDPAEKLEEEWHLWTPLFDTEMLDDDEFERIEKEQRKEAWENIRYTERTYLWTRPQPPGLVFFVIAYILLLIFGSPALVFYIL
ncbi:MAG: prepilin peptidase [Candidatus Heimdallarchaeota archaeon]|nr:prepilin peptidase [Candidatus Heimdallarchaeota archaeon]